MDPKPLVVRGFCVVVTGGVIPTGPASMRANALRVSMASCSASPCGPGSSDDVASAAEPRRLGLKSSPGHMASYFPAMGGFLRLCFRFQNRDTLNHCLNRRPNGMNTNRTTLGALRRSSNPDLRPPMPILVPDETVSRRFMEFLIYGLDASRAAAFLQAPSFRQTSPKGNGTLKA